MLLQKELRVAQLNRDNPKFLFDSLQAILTLFSKSVNVQLNLTVEQIQTIARDLIQDCPDWHIYDFILFFKSCSKGKYGSINYAIDENKIYQYLKLYEEERSGEREKILQNEKQSLVEAGNAILDNIEKLPILKELLEEKRRDEMIEKQDEPESLRGLAIKIKQRFGKI